MASSIGLEPSTLELMDNTQRFTGRAEDYDRYRQRYPTEEILSRLREWCGLTPEWLVADIGAGTGMVAEVFLVNGNRVLAVEPNPDMRDPMRACVEGHLARAAPRLEVIDATAEATTLPAASVDLVAAGRAFHWFDEERARAEFRRILKPEGWVVLLAVDRHRESTDPAYRGQIDAYEHLFEAHGVDYTRVVRAGYRSYDTMETFLDGELHQTQLQGIRDYPDYRTFRGHTMSLSVSPQPGHPKNEVFERELRAHFDTFARDGVLTIPTVCWITAGRFLPQ
jgi:ubiquinone/menaquinone biosynthesis C-methylase UbiE